MRAHSIAAIALALAACTAAGRALRTRASSGLDVGLGVVLLSVAALASACGPAEPGYTVVASPAGGELKLEELSETLAPGGEPALLLRYRTDLDLSDVPALEREIVEVWNYLRPRVEARGFDAAVIQAAYWEPPSWQRRGAAAQYVIERSRNGQGSWAVRAETSLASATSADGSTP